MNPMDGRCQGNNSNQPGNFTVRTNNNKNELQLPRPGATNRPVEQPAELANRPECIKGVREFNREMARYSCLLVSVGSIHDSDLLRDELRHSRSRACELAQLNKTRILPHVKGGRTEKGDPSARDYEKLWTSFCSCLEQFVQQLCRTYSLLQLFTLHSYNPEAIFINTGIADPVLGHKHGASAGNNHGETSECTSLHKGQAEQEDIAKLSRDICDLQSMVQELHQRVGIIPWTIEPAVDIKKNDGIKSLNSGSEVSLAEEPVAVYIRSRYRRRKYVCLILAVLLVFLACSTVVGVCLALLT